jgi:hypothetical protein
LFEIRELLEIASGLRSLFCKHLHQADHLSRALQSQLSELLLELLRVLCLALAGRSFPSRVAVDSGVSDPAPQHALVIHVGKLCWKARCVTQREITELLQETQCEKTTREREETHTRSMDLERQVIPREIISFFWFWRMTSWRLLQRLTSCYGQEARERGG